MRPGGINGDGSMLEDGPTDFERASMTTPWGQGSEIKAHSEGGRSRLFGAEKEVLEASTKCIESEKPHDAPFVSSMAYGLPAGVGWSS